MGFFAFLIQFLTVWFSLHAVLFLLQRFLNRPNLPVGPGHGPDYELLPTSTSSGLYDDPPSSSSTSPRLKKPINTHGMRIKPFNVRFTTTGLNQGFFWLGSHPRLLRFWKVWYNLGVAFAIIAMVLGLALTTFAASQLALNLLVFVANTFSSGATSGVAQNVGSSKLHKRLVEAMASPGQDERLTDDGSDNNMVFVPVVPGLTLPLSHLPYYLLALLISGIVHEAGHALAAGRERTHVSSTGVFFYILYPGAFVDISSRALDMLAPLQQLRVICAGVWHNILLFLLAWLCLSSGMVQHGFRIVGWRQLDVGVSVVDIDPVSPLYDLLAVGSVVVKLNDVGLVDCEVTWSDVLLGKPALSAGALNDESLHRESEGGFCVPKSLLNASPSDCCLFSTSMPFGHSKNVSLSCFVPYDANSQNTQHIGDWQSKDDLRQILAPGGQCIPSMEILARSNPVRCQLDSDCNGGNRPGNEWTGMACYEPFAAYSTAAMTRIQYQKPPWAEDDSENEDTGSISARLRGFFETKGSISTSKQTASQRSRSPNVAALAGTPGTPATPLFTLLYQGDPKDIWEAIQVTRLSTRWSFLPMGLPNAVLLTVQYTMSFSLALSVLNILPARHLDGHHAVVAMIILLRMLREAIVSGALFILPAASSSTGSGSSSASSKTETTSISPSNIVFSSSTNVTTATLSTTIPTTFSFSPSLSIPGGTRAATGGEPIEATSTAIAMASSTTIPISSPVVSPVLSSSLHSQSKTRWQRTRQYGRNLLQILNSHPSALLSHLATNDRTSTSTTAAVAGTSHESRGKKFERGLVTVTTALLGWVMVGSFVQMLFSYPMGGGG